MRNDGDKCLLFANEEVACNYRACEATHLAKCFSCNESFRRMFPHVIFSFSLLKGVIAPKEIVPSKVSAEWNRDDILDNLEQLLQGVWKYA